MATDTNRSSGLAKTIDFSGDAFASEGLSAPRPGRSSCLYLYSLSRAAHQFLLGFDGWSGTCSFDYQPSAAALSQRKKRLAKTGGKLGEEEEKKKR